MDTAAAPGSTAPAPPARPRRRRAILAAAGVLVLAAAVAVPWTMSQRSAAREAATSAAVEECLAVQTADDPADNTGSAAGQMQVIASEVRGDAVLTLAAAGSSPDRAALCEHDLSGPVSQGGIGFGEVGAAERPGAGEAVWLGIGGGGVNAWTGVWGYAGEDVVAVTVTTDAGTDAKATLADGYWVAWWPSDEGDELAAASARTRDGGTVAVDLGA
ncbi:hypothetical protein AAG589_10590 [Isoptericola sp. F-RaC21]|uniref:hypothetical protein n=1 Tax=Isoptericola sp. F-RaC21 TaxID=3141452 RepID=UPI00315BBB09